MEKILILLETTNVQGFYPHRTALSGLFPIEDILCQCSAISTDNRDKKSAQFLQCTITQVVNVSNPEHIFPFVTA